MDPDVLRFEELRAYDPSITAPEYVNVPLPLLELDESDRWWDNLPPSGKSIRWRFIPNI